jgi:hypothetical protein
VMQYVLQCMLLPWGWRAQQQQQCILIQGRPRRQVRCEARRCIKNGALAASTALEPGSERRGAARMLGATWAMHKRQSPRPSWRHKGAAQLAMCCAVLCCTVLVAALCGTSGPPVPSNPPVTAPGVALGGSCARQLGHAAHCTCAVGA